MSNQKSMAKRAGPTTLEMARVWITNSPPNTPKEWLEFPLAVIEGRQPQYYLKELKNIKNCSDELVSDRASYIKQQYSGKENIKGRRHVIMFMRQTLEEMLDECVIKDKGLTVQIEKFSAHKWNASNGAKGTSFTTPKELELMNRMLDTVIEHLKIKYNLE